MEVEFCTWSNSLQLVPLLAAGNLPKLLLGDSLHQPVNTGKDLLDVVEVKLLDLGPAQQLLDADEAVANQVLAEAVVDLLEDPLLEPDVGAGAGADVKDLVEVAALQEGVGGDLFAHEKSLVGLGGAETLGEGAGGGALGDESERGEGGEEEGVGGAVDEVGDGDDGGGEADGGAVEGGDEDLGVGVEGAGEVEVVDEEGVEEVTVLGGGGGGIRAGEGGGDVGAAVGRSPGDFLLAIPGVIYIGGKRCSA